MEKEGVMKRTRFCRRAGGLLLAAAIGLCVGCAGDDPPVPGQVSDGNWGEYPGANDTLPWEFTETTGEATTTLSVSPPETTTGTAGTSAAGTSTGSAATSATTAGTTSTKPPAPQIQGEFRGVWVSHYEMEDLLTGKDAAGARAALDTLMDNCRSYGMNAVILHVRANSDAYYKSKIFKPVKSVQALIAGGFDPLAYAVQAAHKRGLQLHAWLNPYRIGTDESYAVGDNAKQDVWFSKFSNSQYNRRCYYYIPTSTTAQKTILDGVREIVEGYDVDGIHFDDYFYPNNSDSKIGINHKQAESFETGFKPGGGQSLGDWRRAAVDALVSQVYAIVHRKKNCVFGISPSHNITRARETEYADTTKWLANRGYIDYLCPQVYFGFEHNSSAFDTCTKEWLRQKKASSVSLLIGVGIYKTGIADDEWADHSLPAGTGARGEWANHDDIMKRQVEFLRGQKDIGGMLFYSYSDFDPAAQGELKGANLETAKREVEHVLPLLKAKT